MRRIGSRTIDVVLVAAMFAIPVVAVIEAIEGHPGFLVLMGVTFAMQAWRAKFEGHYLPAVLRRRIPGRDRATSPSRTDQSPPRGEHQ